MATSPSETPSRRDEPPTNNSFSSSSPPEFSPPSPPASSSSSPPVSSHPSPPPPSSPPPFSPPPAPSAPPPTTFSFPAPPRSQSTPPQSPPLPSLPSSAPPQSPAPTRTPDALPIPSTVFPSQSEPRNTSPDARGNSNPPTVFSPPPSVPAGGPPAPAAPPSPPSSGSPNSGNTPSSSVNTNAIIVAGIFVAAILLLSIVVFCLMCPRKKKKQSHYMDAARPPQAMGGDQQYLNGSTEWHNNPQFLPIPPQPAAGGWVALPHSPGHLSSEHSAGFSPLPASPPGMGGFNQSQFSYEELAAATAGFSQPNLLGQGGFGYVHKGVLNNGKEVAVKSLKTGSGQGEREFQAEVEIISRVHHRHLASLVGYCIGQGQRMLVYEFVPNKTLEFHLHGKGQPVMDWATRLKIAVGSAKGLAYLHEDCHPRIIHRDIKTANILLDENFEAMVADFGLAKLSTDNNTHVSTRVMGTFGYMAPEYASSGKLTEKSDVFSFGVMLLELITGRRPVDLNNYEEDSLVDWARPLLAKTLEDGNYAPLADSRLEGNYNQDEMSRMAACAAASIRHSAKRRPKMSQIMHALEGNSSLDSLNDNPKTVQSAATGSANESRMYDTVAYNADMMKFKLMVMSSQEFNSSEYGGNSGENGLDPSSSSSNSDSMKHSGYQVHNNNRV